MGGINPSIDTGEDFDIARKLAFSGFEVVFYRDLVYHDSHLSISELLAKDLRRAKNFGMFPLEAQTGISLQEYLFCHVKVGIFEALQNLFSERETFYAVVPIVLVCRIMVYLVMSPFNILSRQRWSKPRITQTRITP